MIAVSFRAIHAEIARTQIGRQQASGDQGAAPGAPRQPRDRSGPSARMGLHDLDPHIMRRAIAGTDPDHHRQPGRRRVEVGRQEQFVDTIGRAAPEGTPPRRAALRGTARRGSSALSRCAGPGAGAEEDAHSATRRIATSVSAPGIDLAGGWPNRDPQARHLLARLGRQPLDLGPVAAAAVPNHTLAVRARHGDRARECRSASAK